MLSLLGLAFALVAADRAWHDEGASFWRTWETGTRRFPRILAAAIVVSVALFLSSLTGILGDVGSRALGVVVMFPVLYLLAAAAIGDLAIVAAVRRSLALATARPLATLAVAVLFIVCVDGVPSLAISAMNDLIFTGPAFDNPVLTSLIVATCTAIAESYLACVLAKTFRR